MNKFEGVQEGPLTIRREETAEDLILVFEGKSILRDPTEFLQPILLQVVEEIDAEGKRLVLDFSSLAYMNSSTFTPLVKTLERARLGSSRMTVLYDADQKWQSVSFSALKIFATDDDRLAVVGKE